MLIRCARKTLSSERLELSTFQPSISSNYSRFVFLFPGKPAGFS